MTLANQTHLFGNVLPERYPSTGLPIETLLNWAHLQEPPFDQMRAAAPWLKADSEVRAYLAGVVEGQIAAWVAVK